MTTDSAELWPGYEQTGEEDLLALLESKVDAALDEDNPAVDKRVAKDFAQAVASYEWLKERRRVNGRYYSRLHARADEVRIESWRPR